MALNRESFVRGFTDELEKRGVDPLSIGLGAAGGHLATNYALGKAMKGPRLMPDILRQGYRHGLERRKMSPLRESMVTKTIGPEVPIEYHKARGLGRIVRVLKKAKTEPQKARILKRVSDKLGKETMPEELKKMLSKVGPETSMADIAARLKKMKGRVKALKSAEPLEHARRAALRERVHQRAKAGGREGVVPVSRGARMLTGDKGVHEKSKPSMLGRAAQNIPEVAALAGTAAGSPVAAKALGHIALNRAREVAAGTEMGKRMVSAEMQKGLEGKLSRAGQKAKSLLISPGFAGIGDVGTAARKVIRGPEAAPSWRTGLREALARRTRAALSGIRGGLSRVLGPRSTRTRPLPAP
jgi:uncharacterized protein YbjQ (UPF0145 family)